MEPNLIFKNYKVKKNLNGKIKLNNFLNKINNLQWPKFFNSYKNSYRYSYSENLIKNYKKFKNINVIGMGGSSLGTKAIYNFLKKKINKNVTFSDNLNLNNLIKKKKKLNLIISKSGNTLETVVNFNTAFNRNDKNIFITENKKSYLYDLAQKLKADIYKAVELSRIQL